MLFKIGALTHFAIFREKRVGAFFINKVAGFATCNFI